MNEAVIVLVVGLLLAFFARIYWRLIVNLLVILGLSLIFTAIFFVVLGIERLSDWA